MGVCRPTFMGPRNKINSILQKNNLKSFQVVDLVYIDKGGKMAWIERWYINREDNTLYKRQKLSLLLY